MEASLFTSEMAILSPISYGRRTRMKRMPSKYFEDADPIIKAKAKMIDEKLRKRASGLKPLAAKMMHMRRIKKEMLIIFSNAWSICPAFAIDALSNRSDLYIAI